MAFNTSYMFIGMFLMDFITYLIRVLPFILFRKKIKNRFIQSFLYYAPYAVLSTMTFPAIFYCTNSILSATIGCVIALVLAYYEKGLLIVAIGAVVGVFVCQIIGI